MENLLYIISLLDLEDSSNIIGETMGKTQKDTIILPKWEDLEFLINNSNHLFIVKSPMGLGFQVIKKMELEEMDKLKSLQLSMVNDFKEN